jgi:hypothetical protein
MTELLLCCDLDRIPLPNGNQEESPADPLFRTLAKRPELILALCQRPPQGAAAGGQRLDVLP